MPSPEPSPPARPARPRRLSRAGAARVLSPRGALALTPVDGALWFAVRAALAMALPALPIALAGRPQLAVYAMLGAFTTTFGRNLPYRRRAWVLALVALAMTAAVGCGSALAVRAVPRDGGWGAVVVVAATAVVAGAAKFVCDTARLSGLGAVLLLFAFAVAANSGPTWADVLPQTGAAAAGAASAWAFSLSGWLWHPDRPQRLVVAAALRALAELVETTPGSPTHARARHRATAAVLRAYGALGVRPPAAGERGARGGVCLRLTDLAWSLLIRSARRPPGDPAASAARLRTQVRLLTDGRRRSPVLLAELTAPTAPALPAAGSWAGGSVQAALSPVEATSRRAAELLGGRGSAHDRRVDVFTVPALRMTLGTGAAGALALALGLGHGYWAAISAAAVLHSVSVRTTSQRAVQRTLGTLAGLLIAVAVLAAGPGPAALAVVIVVLEFLLEYVVVRNYALGVVFVTPLALLMSELAAPASTEHLVLDRGLGSLLGIAVGVLCAVLVVHDRAAVRVDRALAACGEAADAAERALDVAAPEQRRPGGLSQVQERLAAAVVELREADDAAAGELWEAGVDPAVPAAAEERAYRLLDRLLHG